MTIENVISTLLPQALGADSTTRKLPSLEASLINVIDNATSEIKTIQQESAEDRAREKAEQAAQRAAEQAQSKDLPKEEKAVIPEESSFLVEESGTPVKEAEKKELDLTV